MPRKTLPKKVRTKAPAERRGDGQARSTVYEFGVRFEIQDGEEPDIELEFELDDEEGIMIEISFEGLQISSDSPSLWATKTANPCCCRLLQGFNSSAPLLQIINAIMGLLLMVSSDPYAAGWRFHSDLEKPDMLRWWCYPSIKRLNLACVNIQILVHIFKPLLIKSELMI